MSGEEAEKKRSEEVAPPKIDVDLLATHALHHITANDFQ